MLINPLQNTAKLVGTEWLQIRPIITQKFGERPEVYKQFGLAGHNGLDLRAPEGTPLFSPIEGTATLFDQGKAGYGKYIKVSKDNISILMAHLSEFNVQNGQKVYAGQLIGKTGNTGFSTAPHLHVTVKQYKDGNLLNSLNGFGGAIDWTSLGICWKGTLTNDTL